MRINPHPWGDFPSTSTASPKRVNGNPVVSMTNSGTSNVVNYRGKAFDYGAGTITAKIRGRCPVATSGTIRIAVSIERQNAGMNPASDSFAASKNVDLTASGTAGQIVEASVTFTQAEADALADGEMLRIRCTRDNTVAGNAAGTFELMDVELTD